MKYRVQERKFSSNILERSTDGKTWEAFIAPLVKKEEGDILVDGLLHLYTRRGNILTLAEQMLDEQKEVFNQSQTDFDKGTVLGIDRIVKLIKRH